MYIVVMKLKNLKNVFGKINKENFSDVEKEVQLRLQALKDCQVAMHNNPRDNQLADREIDAAKQYRIVQKAYVSYLQQKSKAHWLKDWDQNSASFIELLNRGGISIECILYKTLKGGIEIPLKVLRRHF